MTQRKTLMRAIHSAGLRLDDAATAANVAVRLFREQRNEAIVAALDSGLSIRQVARIWHVNHALVVRIRKVVTSTRSLSPQPPDIL